MRLIAFIKENHSHQEDPDLIAFANYILNSKIAVNGPQAGPAQIRFFMAANQVEELRLWNGFTKWAVAYFHEPKNQLPKALKEDIYKLIAFTRFQDLQ